MQVCKEDCDLYPPRRRSVARHRGGVSLGLRSARAVSAGVEGPEGGRDGMEPMRTSQPAWRKSAILDMGTK